MGKSYFPKDSAKMRELIRQQREIEHIKKVVSWFAEKMRKKLETHIDRPGWKLESTQYLFTRLIEEMGELAVVLLSENRTDILRESVDVANFAMMIADVEANNG